MEKRYCSLHQHSDASFLDAMIQPDKLAERAAAVGMKAVALTDHGNLHNFVKMYEACEKHGIKFIPGCEFYFTHDHEAKERKSRHITVLAMNNTGLSNLYKMTTWANLPPAKKGGFYYRPRISWKELEKYHEGLIVLSGCMNSPVNAEFGFNEDYDAGKEHAQHLKDIFGRERFFIEIQNVNEDGKIFIPEQEIILEWSRKLASDLNLRKVATNDCHYLMKDDKFAHEILKAIDARATLDTPVAEERIERLRDAICQLPERQRLAIHAFYLQGQSIEDARVALGLSRSGFYSLLKSGRQRLARSVSSNGSKYYE